MPMKICTYLFNAQVMKIINKAKAKPKPTTMPYPKPWLKGALKRASAVAMMDVERYSRFGSV
jgi:hypothetical protein